MKSTADKLDLISSLFNISYSEEYITSNEPSYDIIIKVLEENKKCFTFDLKRESSKGKKMIEDYKEILRGITPLIRQIYTHFTYDVTLNSKDNTLAHFKISVNSIALTETLKRSSEDFPVEFFKMLNRLFAKAKLPERLTAYKFFEKKEVVLFIVLGDFIQFCRIIDFRNPDNTHKKDKELKQLFRSFS